MKKLLILAAAVFALGTSTVSADNDRPISVSELPEKAFPSTIPIRPSSRSTATNGITR